MTKNPTLSSPATDGPDTASWVSDQDYDTFREGYARAMLAVNTVNDTGESLDASALYLGPGRWWVDSPVDLAEADDFLRTFRDTLQGLGDGDMKRHGEDFALSRNRHGAGFWDRGYGDVGDRLTAAAHAYGEAVIELNAADGAEGCL